ncbi:MAG TPA: phasin family protein [Gemmatimonadales bacterium]|jgi:poly(hydroxyalkanoate) granule-associated protein|nr:phasin family protein [Gemmatimonadales bacterium]
MVAKKKTKRGAGLPAIRQSAEQIWLAGLGAFAMAGEEGGKLFRNLVKKGETMEKLNKSRLERVLSRAERLRGDARSAARSALTRVARPIEAGMDTAMSKLGVPTRKEIQLLTRRVEELTRVVQKRGARKARRPAAAPAPVE